MLETGVIFFGLLQSRLLDVATYATGRLPDRRTAAYFSENVFARSIVRP